MSDRDKKTVAGGTASAGAAQALTTQAMQAEQARETPDEIEARALLDSFDGRITEIEQRIDRVLACLNAG